MTPLHQHVYCTSRDESNTLTLLTERMPDGCTSTTQTLPLYPHLPPVDLSVLSVYAEFQPPKHSPSTLTYHLLIFS